MMKKYILMIILSAGTGYALLPQVPAEAPLYTETKTFHMDGYAYQCDFPAWKRVSLYNAEKTYIGTEWLYDGSINPDAMVWEGTRFFAAQNYKFMRDRFISRVESAFSTEERKLVGGWAISVTLYLYPETGRVADVEFQFPHFSPFVRIPVETFRKIEIAVKRDVQFILTPEGKKLNYGFISVRHEVAEYVPPGQGDVDPPAGAGPTKPVASDDLDRQEP